METVPLSAYVQPQDGLTCISSPSSGDLKSFSINAMQTDRDMHPQPKSLKPFHRYSPFIHTPRSQTQEIQSLYPVCQGRK